MTGKADLSAIPFFTEFVYGSLQLFNAISFIRTAFQCFVTTVQLFNNPFIFPPFFGFLYFAFQKAIDGT